MSVSFSIIHLMCMILFTHRYWSLETGKCQKIYRGHTDTVLCMQICGDMMVSGGKECHCKGMCRLSDSFFMYSTIFCLTLLLHFDKTTLEQG